MPRLTPAQCRKAARDFIDQWFKDVSPPHPDDLTVERVSQMLKDAMFAAWKDGFVKALTLDELRELQRDPAWREEQSNG